MIKKNYIKYFFQQKKTFGIPKFKDFQNRITGIMFLYRFRAIPSIFVCWCFLKNYNHEILLKNTLIHSHKCRRKTKKKRSKIWLVLRLRVYTWRGAGVTHSGFIYFVYIIFLLTYGVVCISFFSSYNSLYVLIFRILYYIERKIPLIRN